MKTSLLDKDLFNAGYSVYLITLKNGKENYYYIGQTGDRHHISARPIYYRLSAHLGYADSSKENQFVRGLQKRIPSLVNKQELFIFLNDSEINIHHVLFNQFIKDVDRSTHLLKVFEVEELEQYLISKFHPKLNYHLINNKVISKTIILPNVLLDKIRPLINILES